MGIFDIIHFTEASIESKDDVPSVWACFGFYPKEITWTHLVYDAVMHGDHLAQPKKAVVKLRRFRAGSEEFWQSRLDTNTHASGVAAVFTEKTGAGKISFVEQHLAPLQGYSGWDKFCRGMKHYDFRDLKKNEIVLIEPLVSDRMVSFQQDIILDAFSHFSYVEGKHQSVIAVFMGSKCENEYSLITPKIYTSQKEIHDFFSEHICNDLCSGWSKPNAATRSNVPLFDLPRDHLKLQKQTSVRVQEPGEHMKQIKIPSEQFPNVHNSFDRQSSVSDSGKRKVTTIMHAVYVHDDPIDQKEPSAPMQNQLSAPYLDHAIYKEQSEANNTVLKNNTDQFSPKTKGKPVRVRTLDNQNVGIPKQLNTKQIEKPEIKPKPQLKEKPEVGPKPEIKQKPAIGPKPEIKPKPKLKRQSQTEQDTDDNRELDEYLGAQKLAVHDELRAKLAKISNKERETTNSNPKSIERSLSVEIEMGPIIKVPQNADLVPQMDKLKLDQHVLLQTQEVNNRQGPKFDPAYSLATNLPPNENGITEKKVKSKKSLRKQATIAT